MAPLTLVWLAIDRIVDGKVTKLKSKDGKRKYVIPACYEDIRMSNNRNKKENYKDVNYLIRSGRMAMENGDAQVFYRIFCLMSELNKHNTGSSGCFSSSDLKHLDYDHGKRELSKLVRSDQSSMKHIKNYAWLMESIMPSPTGGFRLGTGTIFMAVPFLGALLTALMNSMVYIRIATRVSAPRWLVTEIFLPLFWAVFFSFIMPSLGDLPASRISPSRRAARKVKYWLKLRTILSLDERDAETGLWISKHMSSIFPNLPDGNGYTWRYSDDLRKEIFGDDLKHLYKTKIKNRIEDKV
ncbi:hypothetical protein V866_007032 [Kwoniella sp. B9012]